MREPRGMEWCSTNGTVEDPEAWKSFADADLRTARVLFEREDAEAFARIIVFHAHQAAEKYLKGLLAAHGEEPPRVHSLPELLRRAIAYVPELDSLELRDAATDLNNYYVPSRYPAEVGGPTGPVTAKEAIEALTWAESIVSAVRSYLDANEG